MLENQVKKPKSYLRSAHIRKTLVIAFLIIVMAMTAGIAVTALYHFKIFQTYRQITRNLDMQHRILNSVSDTILAYYFSAKNIHNVNFRNEYRQKTKELKELLRKLEGTIVDYKSKMAYQKTKKTVDDLIAKCDKGIEDVQQGSSIALSQYYEEANQIKRSVEESVEALIVSELNHATMLQKTIDSNNRLALFIGVPLIFCIIFGCIIFAVIMSGKITQPVVMLSVLAHKIADGDLKIEVDKSLRDRPDEMGTLAESISKMVYTLRSKIIQIEQAHHDLLKKNRQLQIAQSKLIQSEKMASIGQLAAGVAHEINNPVGFVFNNIQILEEYCQIFNEVQQKTMELIQLIEADQISEAKTRLKEIKTYIKETNFDTITKDMNVLIDETKVGLERVKKIVLDLRGFAREDKGEMEYVVVKEVIEGVLSLVTSEVTGKAELIKKYNTTSPVKCNVQKLGQVILNLLINAYQAMKEKGNIIIETLEDEHDVSIRLSDNGIGIPKDKLDKIFDPFFTTKPVGEGTGLGLSISYEIIQKHGGELSVESVEGEGTTFTIKLPKQTKV